jgi:hypothetical protein
MSASRIRNGDNEKLRRRGRTSICRSTVLNLGIDNPRVVVVPATKKRLGKKMPQKRTRRAYLPSSRKVLEIIRKCFPLNAGGNICPDYGLRFETAFRKVVLTGVLDGDVKICGTPLRWISHALGSLYSDSGGGDSCCAITQLQSLDEMFMKNGSTSNYLSEFILMDVILNRKVTPTAAASSAGNHTTVHATTGEGTTTAAFDPDAVVMASAYGCEDLDDDNDYKYRTLLAFLPGAGVFYCSREWRRKTEGIEGSLIALDMSWLRIRPIQPPPLLMELCLQFGEDGYVKRFSSVSKTMVSAWRVSYNPAPPTSLRVMFTSTQCADHEGPRMPPDLVVGHDLGAWPVADRAQEYNRRLANSKFGQGGWSALCCWVLVPQYTRDLLDD